MLRTKFLASKTVYENLGGASMLTELKQAVKRGFPHLYSILEKGKRTAIQHYYLRHHMLFVNNKFHAVFGRYIDWKNPRDLNEKINWLKFREDPYVWAKLSDKYLVREHVARLGLADLLVPIYGRWETAEDVIAAWDTLPEEFVLKSNNGSGRLLIVSKNNGGKGSIKLEELKKTLDTWLAEKDFGLALGEFHYQFIDNCIIAEALLKDDSCSSFSRSLVDYKIWCFDGKPYCCLVVYDRVSAKHHYYLDYYDLDWNKCTYYMSDNTPTQIIPRPENWEKMLEAAAVLAEGHPQVRVDFYNINGKIYFGELTFTSLSGFMTYYTEEALNLMGAQIHLNDKCPYNKLANKRDIEKLVEGKTGIS